MRTTLLGYVGYTIAFVVLLATLYVGAYFAMVERNPKLRPAEWMQRFFAPIYKIDQQIIRWQGYY